VSVKKSLDLVSALLTRVTRVDVVIRTARDEAADALAIRSLPRDPAIGRVEGPRATDRCKRGSHVNHVTMHRDNNPLGTEPGAADDLDAVTDLHARVLHVHQSNTRVVPRQEKSSRLGFFLGRFALFASHRQSMEQYFCLGRV
jgi:hypothetical protein